MTKGRSIRLFLADGTPGGIITAEIMNWTGHVILAPRSRLADLIQRPEVGRTGIYILAGADPEEGLKPLVYVGETDNVGKRLVQHNKDNAKEFWERTCVVTSKDQNLTKAHARYLESRLIAIANGAGRAKLLNGTAPDHSQLPEGDLSDMEFFIEQLRIVLPVLGLELLKDQPRIESAAIAPAGADQVIEAESPIFELISKKHDIRAEAREMDGDFVVFANSQAQESWIGTASHHYKELHRRLIEEGVLIPGAAGRLRFYRDYAFRSPSAASAVIVGRPDNGRTSWCVKGTKKSYAAWQEEQIAAVASSKDEE